MAKIASSHVQSMTQLGGGAPCGDDRPRDDGRRHAGRCAGQEADRAARGARQSDLDRATSSFVTTDATLRNQQTLAKMQASGRGSK